MTRPRLARVTFGLLISLGACGAPGYSSSGPGHSGPPGTVGRHCPEPTEASDQLSVAMPAEQRADMEVSARTGPVVVRFRDCQLHVLSNCSAKGAYAFESAAPRTDHLVLSSPAELERRMPAQTAALEGELSRADGLSVFTRVVGRYVAAPAELSADALMGDCSGATHLVASIDVGAFVLRTGRSSEPDLTVDSAEPAPPRSDSLSEGPSSGSSLVDPSAHQRTLTAAGNWTDCSAASAGAEGPPRTCSEIVAIHLSPLGAGRSAAAIVPPAARPDHGEPPPDAGAPGLAVPDGALLKGSGPDIYLIEAGKRRHVPDPSTFNAMGLDWSEVKTIPDAQLELVPLGEELPRR